jgi:hypothetical protein
MDMVFARIHSLARSLEAYQLFELRIFPYPSINHEVGKLFPILQECSQGNAVTGDNFNESKTPGFLCYVWFGCPGVVSPSAAVLHLVKVHQPITTIFGYENLSSDDNRLQYYSMSTATCFFLRLFQGPVGCQVPL